MSSASSLQRSQSSASQARYGAPLPPLMGAGQRMERVRERGGEGRRVRFGPAPGVVRGSEGEEGKGKGSVVSTGTEWPTQSGVGGGRF